MSETKKGKHYSPATELTSERASAMNKGRVMSAETKRKISEAKQGQTPWNKGLGTKSSENEKARKTKQYRDWRKSVFERDDYTCRECNVRGGKLNADHIEPFAYFPELRYEITNGRTLCYDCHRATKTWGFRATNGVFNLASS